MPSWYSSQSARRTINLKKTCSAVCLLVRLMDIVVVGDRYFISLFRMVGIDVVEAKDEDSAVAKVQKIVNEESAKVLFISERVALRLKELREKLLKERRFYPVFVIIPDFEGVVGSRKEELLEFVNKSMGVQLKVGD